MRGVVAARLGRERRLVTLNGIGRSPASEKTTRAANTVAERADETDRA